MLFLHKVPFVMYGEHPSEYGDRIDEAFEPKMREHYFVDDTNIDNLILGGESAEKFVQRIILIFQICQIICQ